MILTNCLCNIKRHKYTCSVHITAINCRVNTWWWTLKC